MRIIRVLGVVAVEEMRGSPVQPPGLVPSAVLAHLALGRGHVLSADALTDRVWDEPPDNARNALQAAVSRLRRAFGPDLVASSPGGYRVDVGRLTVDLLEAEGVEQACREVLQGGDPDRAAALAAEGLAWFSGDPMSGLESRASRAARISAEELRLRLFTLRGEGLLAAGRPGESVAVLRDACATAPFTEPLHGLLMRALAADGRPNDALTVYDGLRRRLVDELGVDPSPQVSGVFSAILAGQNVESAHPAGQLRAQQAGSVSISVSAPHDVGILLTDVVGSTRLWGERPDDMPAVLLAHHAAVASEVGQCGGRLPPDQGEGDARLAVFPSAAAAARAAGQLQRRLAEMDWPGSLRLSVRMAVDAGSVVEADGNVFGQVVNRCARLRGLAHGGQVLLSRTCTVLAEADLGPEWVLTPLGRVPLRDFDDEEVAQLDRRDSPVTFPPLRTSVRLPTELASFVGRRSEVLALSADISRHRLVTLIGIGGSGKTRLALQVARSSAGVFPGGVTFVDLASASSAAEAFDVVLAALEIHGSRSGAEGVRGQVAPQTLLVLDNLEQIPDAATLVSGLLDVTPAHLLTTSRGPVGVPGECVRAVEPLSHGHAVELLLERATDAVPGIELDPATARELALLLDGIPLAIELAAARLRVLDLASLVEAIRSRLDLLVDASGEHPARHFALETLLDDAWHQLSADGRQVLAVLGVFRAGTTVDAVCDASSLDTVAVIDTVQGLLSAGLVRSRPRVGGGPELSILELVRRLALQRTSPAELSGVRRACALSVIDRVGRQPRLATDQLREDVRDTIRAVVEGHGGMDPLELVPDQRLALGRVAFALGWWEETVSVLEPLERSTAEAANPLGVALLRRGLDGDTARGRRLLTRAAKAGDVDAAAALGGSYRGVDAGTSFSWYVAALELDGSDPYALGNVLEVEVGQAHSLLPVEQRRDQLEAAVGRRRAQAAAGADLPWPWFDLAKFELLLGHDLDGMHRLLDAIAASTHARQLQSSLASIEAMTLPTSSDSWALAAQSLRVAARLRFPSAQQPRDPRRIAAPVLVLVGASTMAAHDDVMTWAGPLRETLLGTVGTLISGGTAQGVSALAAAVAADLPGWRAVGYLPSRMAAGILVDDRYDEVRRTPGEGFSLAEPLAYWNDIADAGLSPTDVHVLGIGGTVLTDLELHLASALGAQVAIGAAPAGAGDLGETVRLDARRLVGRDRDELRDWLRG